VAQPIARQNAAMAFYRRSRSEKNRNRLGEPSRLCPRGKKSDPFEFPHQIRGRKRLFALSYQIIFKLFGLGVNPW